MGEWMDAWMHGWMDACMQERVIAWVDGEKDA